jgi:single-strand DNA-binding protein
MADINEVRLLGRIGADAEFSTTQSGRDVASFSLATDTGWYDKDAGEWHKNLHWHRIVTFQSGLIARLRERGKKGARVIVDGELQYRDYRKQGESSDRHVAEVLVNRDGGLNFIDSDRPAGA